MCSSLPVVFIALLLCDTIAYPHVPTGLEREECMGMYLGGRKVGWVHRRVIGVDLSGKAAYRLEETSHIRLSVGEATVETNRQSTLCVGADHLPVSESLSVSHEFPEELAQQLPSSVRDSRTVEATYGRDAVECITRSGARVSKKTVLIPKNADMAAASMYELGARRLSVGDKAEFTYLDMDDLAFKNKTLRVLRREKIAVDGKRHDALVVIFGDEAQEKWVTETGRTLKYEMAKYGVVVRAESCAEALKSPELAGMDMTMIETDRTIPDPQNVKELRVRLIGVYDKELVRSDDRQSATYDAPTQTAEYRVTARPFDPAKSMKLPVAQREYAMWLRSSSGIQADDKKVQAQSKLILGDERNAYTAVSRLRAWVRANMKCDSAASTRLSAADILRDRTGDCKHHALLYTALARAARIPTRLVAGIAYYEGSFRGHLWAESFVGEWVPIDPMLDTDAVDATHIKLCEGNLEEVQRHVLRAIGIARADILEYSAPGSSSEGTSHVIYVAGNIIRRSPDGSMSALTPDGWTDAATPDEGSIVVTAPTGYTYFLPPDSRIDPPDTPRADYSPGRIVMKMMTGGIMIVLEKGSEIVPSR
jgi:hypothetical protein